jgi:hypothetical protein
MGGINEIMPNGPFPRFLQLELGDERLSQARRIRWRDCMALHQLATSSWLHPGYIGLVSGFSK